MNFKMRQRSLGLCAVVLWLSAVWHTSANAALDCRTPVIQNGFFAPQNIFLHDTQLYYTCNEGYKTAGDFWWATITCQNGQLSSEPQCIDETTCFDPNIPNANYTISQLTTNGTKLRIRCNEGYEDKHKSAIALCQNGVWTRLPVCDKKEAWCGPPPKVPNALIINRAYQEMFPDNEEVQYKCQDGFEPEANYSVTYCSYGNWEPVPSCKRKKTNEDGGHVPDKGTTGSSGSDDGNNGPMFTTIDKCGAPLAIENGDFLRDVNTNMYLTYQCELYYKLQGNSRVLCYRNGAWSQVPECVVDYCELDTDRYEHLGNKGVVFIKSGTKVKFDCSFWKSARAECINRQLRVTECCLWGTHNLNLCGFVQEKDSL